MEFPKIDFGLLPTADKERKKKLEELDAEVDYLSQTFTPMNAALLRKEREDDKSLHPRS